jgi:hypothetical protein
MKLTLVLLLVPLAWISGALAQSPTPPDHEWRQSQHRDAANTYTFTRFVLAGRFLTPLPGHPADRPALRLDCITPSEAQRSKLLAADLLVGTPLKIAGPTFSPRSRYAMTRTGPPRKSTTGRRGRTGFQPASPAIKPPPQSPRMR